MALQAIHGLVRRGRLQDLTAQHKRGESGQEEIDKLLAEIGDLRTQLQRAREIGKIGELLCLIYRLEDRIKDIRRGPHSRRFSRAAHRPRL